MHVCLFGSSLCSWLALVWIVIASPTARAAELLPPGFRPPSPGVHALLGGQVIVQPGTTLARGTIVIRDGLIAAVGTDVPLPPDARVWDMTGHTLYAGFIDPHWVLERSREPVANRYIEPIDEARDQLTAGRIRFFGVGGEEMDPGRPGAGSELSVVRPEQRAADLFQPSRKSLEPMRELGFTAANAVPNEGLFQGASALMMLSDVNPNEAILRPSVFQHVAFQGSEQLRDTYPGSLMGVIATIRQVLLDAQFDAADQTHYREHPAERPRPGHHPSRAALRDVLAGHQSIAFEPGSALMVDRAARLALEFSIPFHIVASGEEWRRPDLAIAAAAHFVVPLLFPELPKLPDESDWDPVSLDQLRAWDWAPQNPALLRQSGLNISLTTHGLADLKHFRKNLRLAIDRGLEETDALAGLTTQPARLCGVADRLGTIEPGKIANLTIVAGASYFDTTTRVHAVWIDGAHYAIPETKKPENQPGKAADAKAQADANARTRTDSNAIAAPGDARKKLTARSPQAGRGPILTPPALLIRGATLWTCGPRGRVTGSDLLVVQGKIKALGPNLAWPADLPGDPILLEMPGTHITPGLIDAHNHSMILDRVNESTLPSTAMVRIGDVINSETVKIKQQLAGGLTVANLLHGSANPVGGQNAIIKLRDGAGPEELKFEGAPAGIKFALGENVKQSNWGEKYQRRFPQTRMGVPTFVRNRFIAARQYLDRFESRAPRDPPVRRDLELETLGQILNGQRWIHCHSYRQDEILAFLRLMESLGVRVGTLQHILEGYKVADEIARHGAGASAFSDWWAYKFEVYDAIPYAGSLMHERGVLVSFNSDSSDLARRMNLEAAKAVKYGGLPEETALLFVTLNPANQLRIDHRVGSLEPGKDADFVIWSHAPLDTRTVCLETWIDGKKYFDRTVESMRGEQLKLEREELLSKAKRLSQSGPRESDAADPSQDLFFRVCLEHQYDHADRHCMEENH